MSSGGDDEAKRLILARRARFVAAAVAMNAVMCGGEGDEGSPKPGDSSQAEDGGAPPAPCLTAPKEPDAGAPKPCLDVGPPPDAGQEGGDGGTPQPCLKFALYDGGS